MILPPQNTVLKLGVAVLVSGLLCHIGVVPAVAEDPEFFKAIRSGKTARVERLIADGAYVGQRDERGRTSLHVAAESGERGLVPLLVATGADINARDAGGATPLFYTGCRARMIITLVAFGARIDAADNNGTTPLHLACRNCVTNVGLVLALGADANPRDIMGRTPLHELVPQGQSPQIIETAFKDTEREGYISPSTAKYAASDLGFRHTLPGSERDLCLAVIQLLHHQADVNAADREGKRPLDLVYLDSVKKLLVDHGAEPGK